ncbi:hypothetical protein BG015_008656 [Linnemannia schmuckeri]|uniref:Calcineurin-like phosphoesterase domain-containing protein n=1 Tax=Linnemannia schmuckeri TaxID=64567 RepID=A0A9P5VAD0_9FUNG|nr:hypothetical protein BG015_008656 [Linnemannia schmuckeri]
MIPHHNRGSKRIVAVGDLHSDYNNVLMDNNVDRGNSTIAIYQLLQKLRKQAKRAVANFLGNHEVMNLQEGLRYVTEKDKRSPPLEAPKPVKSPGIFTRQVSGHPAQSKSGKVLSLCSEGYISIDVGITAYHGRNLAALKIIENCNGTQTASVIYPTSKIILS